MSDFIAIDFETANEQRWSPCAVGWALWQDGAIVDTGAMLIRPPEFRFEPFNVSIHGITSEMCRDAPAWPDIVETLAPSLAGRLVVAHNAAFDMSVLRRTCEQTNVPVPELHFACTMRLARIIWPGEPCYSLPDVAARAGIGEFAHHDAAADAWASASIAAVAINQSAASDLESLLEQLHVVPGRLAGSDYNRARYGPGHSMPNESTPGVDANPDHPFYGRKVVFTGGLGSMERDTAWQAVLDAGGKPTNSVSRFTDYIVVGDSFHGLRYGHLSHKLEKAVELHVQGAPLELVTERDFLSLLFEDA